VHGARLFSRYALLLQCALNFSNDPPGDDQSFPAVWRAALGQKRQRLKKKHMASIQDGNTLQTIPKENGSMALTKEDVLATAQVMGDKKAQDVVLLEVAHVVSYADYFLIGSGRSTVQVKAIVNAIEEHFYAKGIRPLHVEGASEGRWVLLDYDDVIIHVFLEEARQFYNIERLWRDVPRTTFADDVPPATAPTWNVD
jgi:ribosome-associated protein